LKINWKVRFKNPTFVIGTFIPGLFLLAQLLLSFISTNIYPIGFSISDDMVHDALGNINLFAFLVFGVTAPLDPLVKGFSDSGQALLYQKPKENVKGLRK
jgi:phi LC3 family holin